jgi:sugar (pentulose or hexulose) kinase
LLLSTGTWSIALNPFSDGRLSQKDIQNNTLNYMRIDGSPVKASRLFLGNEYKLQLERLKQFYQVDQQAHKEIRLDKKLNKQLAQSPKNHFAFKSLNMQRKQPKQTQLQEFQTFKIAYHQLMRELVALQIEAAERAIGEEQIEQLFIDGGFADNDLFVQLLKKHFKHCSISTTKTPLGSALGAHLLVSDQTLKRSFLKNHYELRER